MSQACLNRSSTSLTFLSNSSSGVLGSAVAAVPGVSSKAGGAADGGTGNSEGGDGSLVLLSTAARRATSDLPATVRLEWF